MKKNKKPLLVGLIGGMALLLIYFAVLIIANSFSHAIKQFTEMWYWILILVIGFSTQIGLYSYIRISMREKITGATAEVATAGGISSTSMVACCAHHLTDIIPILGISAAAVFLNKFQTLFIVVGVLSNLIGINMMLKIIQKHKLYNKRGNGLFSKLMKFNMKKAFYFSIIFSVFIIIIVLFNSL